MVQGANFILVVIVVESGGFIDLDDVSVVVDGFWSDCRDSFLICRLYHMYT